MQSCIKYGVGYHNGGLGLMERSLVEGLFLKGDLQVLCTTNTLAHGVNLPAHTVVIKSTQYFSKEKGGYVEYDRATILQMSGRAGRPQFDDSGVVIIMTRRKTVHLYENLLSGSEPVESELLQSIAEHLNAEIVLMTVSDVSLAIDWLKCSYLYVRIKKNPEHYRIRECVSAEQLENKLKDICIQNVNELVSCGMIQTEDGYVLKPLEPGCLMTKYYLYFGTMKAITMSPAESTLEDLLHIIAKAQELSWIKLRRNEKKLLNDINSDTSGRIRFHITSSNGKTKKRIQTDEEKIFVLANETLSGEPSSLDFTMSQDVNGIFSNGMRIARCMSEYFIYTKRFTETINALLLAKCFRQRLWENSPYQLKQLVGIGMVTAKALLQAGIDSFVKLSQADPRRLEVITGRKYPFGNHIKESLEALPPRIEINFVEAIYSKQGVKYTLTLTRACHSRQFNRRHIADLVIGSAVNNRILFHEKIRLDQFSSPYTITFHCSTMQENPGDVVASLISEEYVGVDVREVLNNEKSGNATIHKKEENPKGRIATGKKNLEESTFDRFSFNQEEKVEVTMNSPGEYFGSNIGPTLTGQIREGSETDQNRETSEASFFSRPSFNLISDDHQMEENAFHSHTGQIAGSACIQEKREVVTHANVFDHIQKKSKFLPEVGCFQTNPGSEGTQNFQKFLYALQQETVLKKDKNSVVEEPEDVFLNWDMEMEEKTFGEVCATSSSKFLNHPTDTSFRQSQVIGSDEFMPSLVSAIHSGEEQSVSSRKRSITFNANEHESDIYEKHADRKFQKQREFEKPAATSHSLGHPKVSKFTNELLHSEIPKLQSRSSVQEVTGFDILPDPQESMKLQNSVTQATMISECTRQDMSVLVDEGTKSADSIINCSLDFTTPTLPINKRFSAVSSVVPSSPINFYGESKETSFMGCRSIFSFL